MSGRSNYSQYELRRYLQALQESDGKLGESIRLRLRSASRWEDETAEKLTDNICEEAEIILRKQTDPFVQYPGLFELDVQLADALNAYEDTLRILGGGS